jgi:hypothetical protein
MDLYLESNNAYKEILTEAKSPDIKKLQRTGLNMVTVIGAKAKFYDHTYGEIDWKKSKGTTLVAQTGTTQTGTGLFSAGGPTFDVDLTTVINWSTVGDIIYLTVK